MSSLGGSTGLAMGSVSVDAGAGEPSIRRPSATKEDQEAGTVGLARRPPECAVRRSLYRGKAQRGSQRGSGIDKSNVEGPTPSVWFQTDGGTITELCWKRFSSAFMESKRQFSQRVCKSQCCYKESGGAASSAPYAASIWMAGLTSRPRLLELKTADSPRGGVTASTEVIAVKRHTGVHASVTVCKNTIANQNLAYAA